MANLNEILDSVPEFEEFNQSEVEPFEPGSIFLGDLSFENNKVVLKAKRIDVEGGLDPSRPIRYLDIEPESFMAVNTFSRLSLLAGMGYKALFWSSELENQIKINIAVFGEYKVVEFESITNTASPL